MMIVRRRFQNPDQAMVEDLCSVVCLLSLPAKTRWKAWRVLMLMIGNHLKLTWLREQLEMGWRIISPSRERMEVACRGGGKTLMHVICAFVICTGEYTLGMWLAGDSGQLSEAVLKSKNLLLFFTNAVHGRDEYGHFQVRFDNGSILDYNACTMTSGPRKNLILYDEGGKILRQDKKDSYNAARGMADGTFEGEIRLRHFTTLAYGTPGETMFNSLEPEGLVHKFPVEQCPWVWRNGDFLTDKQIHAMPRWWVLMEYYCELVARGGAVFQAPPVVIAQFDIAEFMANHHEAMVITSVDWNPVWGDAAIAMVHDGYGNYVVFAEVRTTDTGTLIEFFNRHAAWGTRNYRVCEKSGEKVFGKVRELAAAGIAFHEHELWDTPHQVTKVTVYQGLVERGAIVYTENCTNVIRQHQLYHFKEDKSAADVGSNEIPKQEDHHLDAISHGIRDPMGSTILESRPRDDVLV